MKREKGEFSPVRKCTRLIRLTSNGPRISELGVRLREAEMTAWAKAHPTRLYQDVAN